MSTYSDLNIHSTRELSRFPCLVDPVKLDVQCLGFEVWRDDFVGKVVNELATGDAMNQVYRCYIKNLGRVAHEDYSNMKRAAQVEEAGGRHSDAVVGDFDKLRLQQVCRDDEDCLISDSWLVD